MFALVAVTALVAIPAAESDAQTVTNIDADQSVIQVSKTGTFKILYSFTDYDDKTSLTKRLTYEAKVTDTRGNTQSSSVSPSTGSLDDNVEKSLTVTAPKDEGTYKLVVTFKHNITYTEDGETKKVEGSEDKEFTFKAVNPINLKITISTDDAIEMSGGVYFYIDGQKYDDSYATFSVAGDGTASVSYDWIADPAKGEHEYHIAAANGQMISGLDNKYTFYVGDNSYTLIEALVILCVIVLILFAIWIYRKPVKNFGKPKSRR